MTEADFSELDRIAEVLERLGETDLLNHPEVQRRLAAQGVERIDEDTYIMFGWDLNRDPTDAEMALLESKLVRVVEGFTQDVIDGEIKP